MNKIKAFFRPIIRRLRVLKNKYDANREVADVFEYDKKRFTKFAGIQNSSQREARVSEIVMSYHVVEKGLTMPRRRDDFGHFVVFRLLDQIKAFERDFDSNDPQVRYGAAVVRAYEASHAFDAAKFDAADPSFWKSVHNFSAKHAAIPPAVEPHMTREQFFAASEAPFPAFAASRHVLRHFTGSIPDETIKEAIAIAMSAPSACNRQCARVHCVTTPELCEQVASVQCGCRGFGTDADKFIVVTVSLCAVRWAAERNDLYTNGGMFALNLLYALHYLKVAVCLLNWSVTPDRDRMMRKILSIPDNEEIVVLLACGQAPETFDVAASPRRPPESIQTWH